VTDQRVLEIVDQPGAVLFDEDEGEGALALRCWRDVVDLEGAVGYGYRVAEDAELLDVEGHGRLQEICGGDFADARADCVAALPPGAGDIYIVGIRREEGGEGRDVVAVPSVGVAQDDLADLRVWLWAGLGLRMCERASEEQAEEDECPGERTANWSGWSVLHGFYGYGTGYD